MQTQKTRQGYTLVKSLFGKYEEIPEDWKIELLGKISELYVPMRDKPKKFDGDIPWLRIEDLDGKYANNSKSNQRVSPETVKDMNLKIYPIGTVLCSCSATIGVCAITTRELITNQTFIGIKPTQELNEEFLYYYLQTKTNHLKTIGAGSTISYISREKFEQFPIILPKLKEQQKIASILLNVDSIINQTQKEIEQTQKLKKGLMQKLLTKGIRHTKFKKVKSLFGKYEEIPEDWKIEKLGNIIDKTQLGINNVGVVNGDGIPLLKMGNLTFGDFDFSKLEYVKENEVEDLESFVLKNGDFLFNTRNSDILVGKCSVWKENLHKAIFNGNIMRIWFKPDLIANSDFVSHFFNSHIGRVGLQSLVDRTTSVAAIYYRNLKNFKIILPSMKEQQQIADILSNIDLHIRKQQEYKCEFEKLKKGLMQKLLTGQIRVKI